MAQSLGIETTDLECGNLEKIPNIQHDLGVADDKYNTLHSCMLNVYTGEEYWGFGIARAKRTRVRLALLALAGQLEASGFGVPFPRGGPGRLRKDGRPRSNSQRRYRPRERQLPQQHPERQVRT